jgi:hypothetical protein
MPFDKNTQGTLTTVVPKNTKENFKKLARKKRWTVSNYLAYLVEKELENENKNPK